MRVRIVNVPPGEAPDAVRRAWVGLVLPIAEPFPSPVAVPYYGVLTGPRTWLGHVRRSLTGRVPPRESCYLVPVDDTLDELVRANSSAATWWRENTPDLIGVGQVFGFPARVCEEIA